MLIKAARPPTRNNKAPNSTATVDVTTAPLVFSKAVTRGEMDLNGLYEMRTCYVMNYSSKPTVAMSFHTLVDI
jgi:hypothetical protein